MYSANVINEMVNSYPIHVIPKFVITYSFGTMQGFCMNLRIVAESLFNMSPFAVDANGLKPNTLMRFHNWQYSSDELSRLTVNPFIPMDYLADPDRLHMILESCVDGYNQHDHEHYGWEVIWRWDLPHPEYHIELHY